LNSRRLNLGKVLTIGRLSDFWNVLREVDPEAVVREAYQPIRIVICGSPGVGKRTLAAAIGSAETVAGTSVLDVYDMPDDVAVALPPADLYLYVTGIRTGIVQRSHVQQLLRRPGTVVYVVNEYSRPGVAVPDDVREETAMMVGLPTTRVVQVVATDRQAAIADLGPGVIDAVPHLALPLGRQVPAFRDAAAAHLIAETSRVNAEFAVVSALPAIVPVVGTLASAGTDIVVLTQNQVMMLLKLAVLHRRPIDNRLQVLSEILPVVGAAFFWRSAARALIAMLPGPLAVAPRGAIAYVGTYVVGRAAEYYYRWGKRPSPALLDAFQREALLHLESAAPLLARISKRFRLW
jgi:hypothetical protein